MEKVDGFGHRSLDVIQVSGQKVNPDYHFNQGIYVREMKIDREFRRPARMQDEVNLPWRRFLADDP